MTYTFSKYKRTRFWAVWNGAELVAVVVYRRGAAEIVRQMQAATA